jgi:hemerythrin-like metal-binding protein
MLIKWQDINSVNVKELDGHHKIIVEITNKLSDGLSGAEVENILKKLDDYAMFHFAAEEKYFKEFNFSKAEQHIKQHQFFVEKIKSFEEKCDKGELQIDELMEFLKDWWIGHINNSDLEYSDFLNQHGIY